MKGTGLEEVFPIGARDILDTIDDGVIVIDENYKIVYANKRFLNDTSFKDSGVIGNYCYKVTHLRDEPCDPLLESCSVEEVIKNGKTVKVIHEHCGSKNEEEIAVEISSSPFLDKNTGKRYAVEVLRCLGSGSNAQLKFNLSQRLSEVGLLAEGVAHEINNPLNNILASIDMIKICIGNNETIQNEADKILKNSSCDLRKYFDLMGKEIERCKDITKKLLLLSRPVSSTTDIVNVNNQIEETISLLSFLASKKNVMVKKNLAADQPLISFSEAGLRQVILNIGLNAIQAVQEDYGIVYFITKTLKDYIYILIIDNGYGIAPDDIKKIFNPFFSKNKETTNTGLGLSISLSIIKSLGGSIEVRSKEGLGTKFVIKIPIKTDFA